MGLEGYTGPTSGRITLGPEGVIRRETFTDRPLSREETEAVAWFTELSPLAQLREVRRLKWNLDEAIQGREAALNRAREAEAEIDHLRARLAQYTPDGYVFPAAAASLLEYAREHGWKTAHAWQMREPEYDGDPGHAWLVIRLAHGSYAYRLTWTCDPGGGGRMFGSGIARAPRRDWHDAPSLKKIKEIITEVAGKEI